MQIQTVKQVKMSEVIEHFKGKKEKFLADYLDSQAESSANEGEQIYKLPEKGVLIDELYENIDYIEEDSKAEEEAKRLVALLEKEIPELFSVQFVCW